MVERSHCGHLAALGLCLVLSALGGCSFGLDFDELQGCRVNQHVVEGACVCLEGLVERDGACACPRSDETFDPASGTCGCAPGLVAGALADGSAACLCPLELNSDGGLLDLDGERTACEALVTGIGLLGQGGNSLVDVALVETEPGARWQVAILERSLSQVFVSAFELSRAADGTFALSERGSAQGPLPRDFDDALAEQFFGDVVGLALVWPAPGEALVPVVAFGRAPPHWADLERGVLEPVSNAAGWFTTRAGVGGGVERVRGLQTLGATGWNELPARSAMLTYGLATDELTREEVWVVAAIRFVRSAQGGIEAQTVVEPLDIAYAPGRGCDAVAEFACADAAASCVPIEAMCDLAHDCPDGSDEAPHNPRCVTGELCDNGVDDDDDGDIDCVDLDCADDAACPEVCDNGVDDDHDTRVDCRDLDCARDAACAEVCDNGIDDDADSHIDCRDFFCSDAPACPEVCDNGVDDDGDMRVDCRDERCVGDPSCFEDCDNGVDDDRDEFIDCDDFDCLDAASCKGNCGADQFQCDSGQCVREREQCDGYVDCVDASDENETLCGYDPCAGVDAFECAPGTCISASWRCDGRADCADVSDEASCGCEPGTEYTCLDRGCIAASAVCDGAPDCADGSDEAPLHRGCGVTARVHALALGQLEPVLDASGVFLSGGALLEAEIDVGRATLSFPGPTLGEPVLLEVEYQADAHLVRARRGAALEDHDALLAQLVHAILPWVEAGDAQQPADVAPGDVAMTLAAVAGQDTDVLALLRPLYHGCFDALTEQVTDCTGQTDAPRRAIALPGPSALVRYQRSPEALASTTTPVFEASNSTIGRVEPVEAGVLGLAAERRILVATGRDESGRWLLRVLDADEELATRATIAVSAPPLVDPIDGPRLFVRGPFIIVETNAGARLSALSPLVP